LTRGELHRQLRQALKDIPPELHHRFNPPTIGPRGRAEPMEQLRARVARAEGAAITARYFRLSPAEREALSAAIPPHVRAQMHRWAKEVGLAGRPTETVGRVRSSARDDIVWNDRGGVDFSRSSALYPARPGQRSIVEVEYTGSYPLDFAAANKAAGFSRTPKGYTWHHLDNYNPITNRGTFQLVETPVHQANQPHTGGVSQYEAATGRKYLYWMR
jgi:hypothetical protein